MRLIDADELFKTPPTYASLNHKPLTFLWAYVVDQITHAPTIDAVPVVRCKDCKRFFKYHPDYKRNRVEGADGDCLDRIINSDNRQFQGVKCYDFCSYGERKDGEG